MRELNHAVRVSGNVCCSFLLLSTIHFCFADAQPANWGGNFSPCNNHSEFLRYDSMDLGVRISTSNRSLAKQFKRAMDFWARILNMDWHEDNTSSCAVQVVDGTPAILPDSVIARSQFTDWRNFQGWIAFDPNASLTKTELYLIAVHEIGHMLGLKHNPNAKSVMYFLDLEGPEFLDNDDLTSLASHHRLRIASLRGPIAVERSSVRRLSILFR
jgi:hypothetical protein